MRTMHTGANHGLKVHGSREAGDDPQVHGSRDS